MKFYVNEQLLSIHNSYRIKNEMGIDIYETTSFGGRITINNMQGKRVAYIDKEIFHLMPNYNVYINNEFVFKITKKFQLFKNDYILSNGYRIEGNYMSLNFTIFDDNNNQIGSIRRQLISIGDKYEISVDDTNKKEIVLAIIMAITNDIDRKQAYNRSD